MSVVGVATFVVALAVSDLRPMSGAASGPCVRVDARPVLWRCSLPDATCIVASGSGVACRWVGPEAGR